MENSANEARLRIYSYTGIVAYIILLIFTPYIKISGRDNFELTFFLTLILAVLLPFNIKKIINFSSHTVVTIMVILFLVLVADTLSIVNFIAVNKSISGVLVNIVPNLKAGLYTILAASFLSIKMDEDGYHALSYKAIPVIAIASASIGILQRFNVFNINFWFTNYYIGTDSGKWLIKLLQGGKGYTRVMGTISNPDFYALELIFFVVFLFSCMIFKRGHERNTLIIAGIILSLFTIIFTQTKTALVVLVVVGVYIAILQTIKGNRKNIYRYLLAIAALVLVPLAIAKLMNLSYVLDIFKYGMKSTSITERLDRWDEALNQFMLHPVIGIGPVIGKYISAVDNEYIQILRNNGVIGFIAHMSLYIYIYITSLRDIFKAGNVMLRQYALAVNCSVLAVLICGITMPTFYHWRNFTLLLIICCLWAKLRDDFSSAGRETVQG